jgi:hypothetical protein
MQNFGGSETASISQTGIIPAGTQSLHFEGLPAIADGGQVQVSIGTQTVPVVQIGTGPNYTLFGANISAWAGKTESISFTVGPAPLPYTVNNWELDDITFSPNTVVPEPSPFALTALGGLLFALYRRLAPKRIENNPVCSDH